MRKRKKKGKKEKEEKEEKERDKRRGKDKGEGGGAEEGIFLVLEMNVLMGDLGGSSVKLRLRFRSSHSS